jgi:hypothetical protein
VTSRRAIGEGSIFPYRKGFAAYVWITTPSDKRQRKYVYGRTREIVHGRWVELTESRARAGRHQGADSWAVPQSMARRHGSSESGPAHVRDVREPREELHRARHRWPAA